jgi:hypothetical protein
MKQGHLATVVGSLCALMLGASACTEERSCTLIGCQNGSFQLLEGDWAPGDYELEVSYSKLGDQSFVCPFQIAADGDADAGTSPYQSTCMQTKGTDRALTFYLGPNVPTLHVNDDADTFQLTIRRDDQVVFDDTIAPEYQVTHPNGPDCGSCRSAQTSIDISAQR